MIKYIFSILIFALSVLSILAGRKYDKIDVHRTDDGKNKVAIVLLDEKFGLVDSLENEILPPIFESISYLEDDLIKVKKDGKYGLFNTNAVEILPVEYDVINFLKKGFYTLGQNWKVGIFALKQQKIIVPVSFHKVKTIDYGVQPLSLNNTASYKTIHKTNSETLRENNTALVYLDNKVSLFDLESGQVLIPFGKYDDIEPSDKYGYIVVSKDENSGIIDYSGQEILPLSPYSLQISEFGFITNSEQEQGFISLKGNILPPQYDENSILFFENGLALGSLSNKVGVIDYNAKEIVVPEYDRIYFEDGYLYAIKQDSNALEKTYIKDLDGKNILPPLTYSRTQYYPESKVAVVWNGNKYGLINEKGKKLLDFSYDNIYFSSQLKVARIEIDKKWGIADDKGKILVKPQYDGIADFIDGVAEVSFYSEQGNRTGLLNINGKEILAPQFDFIFFSLDDDKKFGLAYKQDKVGIVSREGRVTVPAEYESIIYQDRSNDDWGDLAITKKNNQYGLVNIRTGETLFSPENKYVYAFGNGESILFCVRKEEKNAILDRKGNIIIPFTSDIISQLDQDNQYLKKQLSGKIGVVNKEQKEVIPCIYDNIEILESNLLLVRIGNKSGIINLNNEEILPLEYDDIRKSHALHQLIAKKDNQFGFLFLDERKFTPSEVARRYYEENNN